MGTKKKKLQDLIQSISKHAFEFFMVFLGVFLAFWLNEVRDNRIDKERQQEIYRAIYEDLRDFHEAGNRENKEGFVFYFEQADQNLDSVISHKRLPARIRIYGDYWKIEIINSLIDGGVLKEIDIRLFKQISRFNTVHRNFLEGIKDFNQFYDTHITSNYDKGMDFFYQEDSDELKERFAYLYGAMEEIAEVAELLVDGADALSEDIEEEYLRD